MKKISMLSFTRFVSRQAWCYVRPMNRWERSRIVGEYVRARLKLECQQRGRAAKIAEKTGFAAAHISLIRRGKRTVGTEFARAMAELWGVDYETLERLAFQTHGIAYSAPAPVTRDLPNLRATVDWCREGKVYPYRFLRHYETDAEQLGIDKSRREWLLDLESTFANSRAERVSPRSTKSLKKSARAIRSREEPSGVHAKLGSSGASDARDASRRKTRTAGGMASYGAIGSS